MTKRLSQTLRRRQAGRKRYGLYLGDLDRTTTDSQGIFNYAIGLARNLPEALQADETLVLYVNPALAPEFLSLSNLIIRVMPPPRNRLQRLMNDQLSWFWAKRDRLDVMHYPKGFIPLRIGKGPKVVATLHDDIVFQYAAGRWLHPNPLKVRFFARLARRTLRNADVIMTVSETSGARLREWARSFGRKIEPVVTLVGPTAMANLGGARRGDPYFLVVGSELPHKRTKEAVAFTERLINDNGMEARILVLGSDFPAEAKRAERVAGPIANDAMAELMSDARAVITGSEYEGFGLVPLDAHIALTPAVFADNDAAQELYSDLPGIFRVGEYEGFKDAMRRVTELEAADLLHIAESLKATFTWSRITEVIANTYRDAASRKYGE